jgi:hypothetical protein
MRTQAAVQGEVQARQLQLSFYRAVMFGGRVAHPVGRGCCGVCKGERTTLATRLREARSGK